MWSRSIILVNELFIALIICIPDPKPFPVAPLQSHAACASEHCGQLAVNSRGRVLRRWRLQWGSSAALSAATKGLQRVELSRTSGPRGLTAFGAILPIGDPSAEDGIHGEPTGGPGGKRQIWDH